MDEQEIVQAQQALTDIQRERKEISKYDPTIEVEHNIVSLLRHRIEKLQEDAQFEQSVKDAIIARLPEAEFGELIRLLDVSLLASNISTEKILAPFIPRMGDRVPLLDDKKEKKTEDIQEDSRSEDLQAVAELGRAIRLLKEKQQQKKLDEEKS